jgi:hypothetical protein
MDVVIYTTSQLQRKGTDQGFCLSHFCRLMEHLVHVDLALGILATNVNT